MTKRKLKGNVKRALFVVVLCVTMISLFAVTKNLKPTNAGDEIYVMNSLLEPITPVNNITETANFIRPYTSDKVKISKYFYEKDAASEEQERSLIYYENTYLQNSGVVYSSDEEFDVVSVYDGTVIDIKQDEILNNIVYVSHNSSLTTIYYGLKDVQVKINDAITQNTILGKSDKNKFCTDNNSMLFEVNFDGKVINPESFYNKDINEFN